MTCTATVPASLTLTRSDGDGAAASTTVDPGNPMFRGHYPGFPVLPGVCLIDLVDRAMHAWSDKQRIELLIIERCRFLGPVFPGDQVTVELTVTGTVPALRCAAVVTTVRGPAARVWLRYRGGAPR